jgi:hypothetical protein
LALEMLLKSMRLKKTAIKKNVIISKNESKKPPDRKASQGQKEDISISYVEDYGNPFILSEKNEISNKNKIIIKENIMNVGKLNEAVEKLKESVGGGLIATDIWMTEDGQSIAGYNSQPRACALFNQISLYISRSLKESEFPPLGRYFIIDLTDNKLIVVITMGEYNWSMLVDASKSPLGLLLNITIPRVMAAFEEAIVS